MWAMLLTGISLIGSGIQAGALLMFYYGVCPTYPQVEVPFWIRMHVSMDRSIERYMPPLNLLTGTSSLALLFFSPAGLTLGLRIAALLCNIALAVMSEAINVPINKRVAKQAPVLVQAGGPALAAEPPAAELAQLAALRDRWVRWTCWRAWVISAGFILYATAVLSQL
jgi:Anthrone oxygenase